MRPDPSRLSTNTLLASLYPPSLQASMQTPSERRHICPHFRPHLEAIQTHLTCIMSLFTSFATVLPLILSTHLRPSPTPPSARRRTTPPWHPPNSKHRNVSSKRHNVSSKSSGTSSNSSSAKQSLASQPSPLQSKFITTIHHTASLLTSSSQTRNAHPPPLRRSQQRAHNHTYRPTSPEDSSVPPGPGCYCTLSPAPLRES